MSDPTPKLEMVIADPKTTNWRPPTSRASNSSLQLQKIPVADVEKAISFRLRKLQLPDAKVTDSALVPQSSTYYGDFDTGGSVWYEFGTPNQVVVVTQRKILRSTEPMVFLYKSNVKAFQRRLGEGLATIVIPPDSIPVTPFAECVAGDLYITVHFLWRASESDIIRILQNLLASV